MSAETDQADQGQPSALTYFLRPGSPPVPGRCVLSCANYEPLLAEHRPERLWRANQALVLAMAMCGAVAFSVPLYPGVTGSVQFGALLAGGALALAAALLALLRLPNATRRAVLRVARALLPEGAPLFEVFRARRLPLVAMVYEVRDADGRAVASVRNTPLGLRHRWRVVGADGRMGLVVTEPSLLSGMRRAVGQRICFLASLQCHWPLAARAYWWGYGHATIRMEVRGSGQMAGLGKVGEVRLAPWEPADDELAFEVRTVEEVAGLDRRGLLAAMLLGRCEISRPW